MSVTFEAEPVGQYGLRLGKFHAHGRTLETPYFFPVMNVITGPPTPPNPILANGGIWKWLKRLTLLDSVHVRGADHQPALPGFLTQVLHFLDYNISPPMLKRWLPRHERERIPRMILADVTGVHGAHAASKRPFVFLDSGGFQLLGSQRIDLDQYGMKTTPRDILDLQLRFGGDFVATLDYPLRPQDSDETVKERQAHSMANALSALRMVERRELDDKLVFLAVHGRSERESYDYTRTLLARVAKNGTREVPYGLALGSLVPLNNSPRALVAAVRGAMRALRDAPGVDVNRVPVHAFGVSSTVAPYLSLLGVDSYDGFSYAKAAQNLTYYEPGGFSPQKLDKLTDLACRCAGCLLMQRGVLRIDGRTLHGLEAVQYVTGRGNEKSHTTYFDWDDGVADHERAPAKTRAQRDDPSLRPKGVPKSYFYALIALHNLNSNRRQIARLQSAGSGADAFEALLDETKAGPKLDQILEAIQVSYPEMAEALRSYGYKALTKRPRRAPKPRSGPRPRNVSPGQRVLDEYAPQGDAPAATPKRATPRLPARVNAALGPEDFDILRTPYRLPARKVVLLLPCTKTKPYHESSTHRLVEQALVSRGIDLGRIEKVSLSGNYGPVPRSYEESENVLSYDFLLHETNERRIDLLAARLRELLLRDESRYLHVVGYATQKPYRRVLKKAFKDLPRCVLLPEPLKSHTSAQFRAPENLERLADAIRAAIREPAVEVRSR